MVRKKKRLSIGFFPFSFLLIVLVTGCSGKKVLSESPAEQVLFLHYFSGSLSGGINELASLYNQKESSIELIPTPVDHEGFKSMIRIQLDGPNPPDLFSYWAGARTQYLVDKGKLVPLDDLLSLLKSGTYPESIIKACSYNGDFYMLPLSQHYVGFFYNKAIFESLNLSLPETFDELNLLAGRLLDSGFIPFALGASERWPAQFWFDYILLRTEGFDFRQSLMVGKIPYTDPGVVRTFSLWADMIEKDYFNRDYLEINWDDALEMLINGQSAMTLMGTWAIAAFNERGWEDGVDYGFFEFPIISPAVTMTALGPIDGVLLPAGAHNPDGAKDVLFKLADPELQEVFNMGSGAIPPSPEVDMTEFSSMQNEIAELVQSKKEWAFNYDLATPPVVSEAGLNTFRDFLATPKDYKILLATLEKEIQNEYTQENDE